MNRRNAIIALWAIGAGIPMVGFPQAPKTRHIGIIFGVYEGAAKVALEGILAGLREYGYVPGQSITVHARYSAGEPSLMAAQADEMIALKVDVVLTFDTAAAILRQKTTTLPIVLLNSVDPVAAGLVQSFARPGTNVTGMSAMWDQVLPKYFQLLLETNPKITRISMLYDDSITPQVQDMHLRMAGGIALSKGLTITPAKWSTADELRVAFESIRKSRPDALLLVPTFKSIVYLRELVPEIRRLRVPSVGGYGGSYTVTLFGFGTDGPKQSRRAIRYVDQILKGANPAELAIEQYGIYNLAVNLSVARDLGLTIPQSILIQADTVIE